MISWNKQILFNGLSILRFCRNQHYSYSTSVLRAGRLKWVLGHTVFTLAFTGTALVATAVAEYELFRKQRSFISGFNPQSRFYKKKMWMGPPAHDELKIRDRVEEWFSSLVPTQKAFLAIITFNIGIHLAWKRALHNKELYHKMLRWWALRNSSHPITLLTSTMSHSSTLHLFINMYCLWTFLPIMDGSFGAARTVAIFFTGCVCSSYVNVLYKMVRGIAIPSLGASGGILAVVTAITAVFPDRKLTFIIPIISFDASIGVLGLTAFSLFGLFYSKFLPTIDHMAHLAGIGYGYAWHKYIHNIYLAQARKVKSKWRQFRERKY